MLVWQLVWLASCSVFNEDYQHSAVYHLQSVMYDGFLWGQILRNDSSSWRVSPEATANRDIPVASQGPFTRQKCFV